MPRKTLLFGLVAVCSIAVARCSTTPQSLTSPSALITDGGSALNPDGSNLKVTAPSGLGPNGGTVDSLRPALSFTASSGRFVSVPLDYEIEVYTANGTLVYARTIGATSHTLETDLSYETDYSWRVRPRRGATETGPWSGFASFRSPNRPLPPGPTLPFPIPAECGPGDPGNRFACAAAIASQSVEWIGCLQGSGTRCHRFVRQVVFALSRSDPNWRMIVAAPGGNACDCNRCGASDGTMFREDTAVYGGNRVFDMVVGAGGPTPSLQWAAVPGPRATDFPGDAPLCIP